MRFTFSMQKLSLGLALVSMVAAAASAQTLTGVNTRLVQPLDSATATVGQTVAVKLENGVKTPDGVKLPRGSQLVGKIAQVKPSQNGGPASVTVAFTAAQLKGGKQIPVKATLLAAFPSDQGLESQYSDQTTLGVPPDHVASNVQVEQEPGALKDVTLKAAVQDADSGTFSKSNGNFTLGAGTYFQVGVGTAAGGSSTSAAE